MAGRGYHDRDGSLIEPIAALHPEVVRALRARSGMERELRLAHETWEMVRDRLVAFLAEKASVLVPR